MGPRRTCRSGSSRGRIIRADRIVLLVIQIRLSYPVLSDDPGYLGSRRGERYLSPKVPFFPPPVPAAPIALPIDSSLGSSRTPSTLQRGEPAEARSRNCSSGRKLRSFRREMTRSVVAEEKRLAETVRRWENLQSFLLCLEIIRRTRVFLCEIRFDFQFALELPRSFVSRFDQINCKRRTRITERFGECNSVIDYMMRYHKDRRNRGGLCELLHKSGERRRVDVVKVTFLELKGFIRRDWYYKCVPATVYHCRTRQCSCTFREHPRESALNHSN
jgi:hypothetical protein